MTRGEPVGSGPRSPGGPTTKPPTRRADRRIGGRVPVVQLAVTVRYVVPRPRWWQTDVAAAAHGIVADMSMTGVGVVAPRNDGLRVGTVVTIEIRGASGAAIIRRISDVEDSDRFAHHGMEYRQLSAELHDLIGDLVAGSRKEFDWKWFSAR